MVSHHYFELLLGFKAAVTAGQNSVCERRYDELEDYPEHNLIEKMVSE